MRLFPKCMKLKVCLLISEGVWASVIETSSGQFSQTIKPTMTSWLHLVKAINYLTEKCNIEV